VVACPRRFPQHANLNKREFSVGASPTLREYGRNFVPVCSN